MLAKERGSPGLYLALNARSRKLFNFLHFRLNHLRTPTLSSPFALPAQLRREEFMILLTSTLADLTAAKLIDYAEQNMPARPAVAATPPWDPTNTNAYIKASNLNHACDEIYGGDESGGPDPVNGLNPQLLDHFSYLCHLWEQGQGMTAPAKSGPLPVWPAFQSIDLGLFDKWWAEVQQFYDPTSPNYYNETYLQGLVANQYFKATAPKLPQVQIVAPQVPVVTSLSVGAPIPGVTEPLFAVAGGPPVDTQLGMKIVANGNVYQLIDMSPMGGAGDYAWLLVIAAAPVQAPVATPPAPII